MFNCKGCKILKEENIFLRGLVKSLSEKQQKATNEITSRLLDKVAGTVVVDGSDAIDNHSAPPPPYEQEVDKDGNVTLERFNYGV